MKQANTVHRSQSTLWVASMVSIAALMVPTLLPSADAPATPGTSVSRPGREPFATQLHIHQSMSEGNGSFLGHVVRERELGVLDVIFFTDHGWRIAAYTYIEGFSFDQGVGPEVLERPSRANWGVFYPSTTRVRWAEARDQARRRKRRSTVTHTARSVDNPVQEGSGALEVRVSASPDQAAFGRYQLRLGATGSRAIRSLAGGVRVKLAVYPMESPGSDGRMAIRFPLSQQPPGDRAELVYWMAERLPEDMKSRRERGIADHLLTLETGQWNDVVFNLTADAISDGIGGIDNSMNGISLAFFVRNGASLTVVLDDLRIEQDLDADAVFARAHEIVDALTDERLTLYVGQEMSFGTHINAFGPNVPLINFAEHPAGLDGIQTVKFIHRHGGLALLDHPFGIGREGDKPASDRLNIRDSFATRLIQRRCYGADAMEVGYPLRGASTVEEHLNLWDRVTAAGIVITGVGTSDTHDNNRDWGDAPPNNWVTWIWSTSRDMEDLLAGLRSGACYFGDPESWDGRLDLVAAGGGRMGDVAIGGPASREVTFLCEPLPADWTVDLIRNGEVFESIPAGGTVFQVTRSIPTSNQAVVRFCLRDGDGALKVCSNPIYFFPELPEEPLPAGRRIVMVGKTSHDR